MTIVRIIDSVQMAYMTEYCISPEIASRNPGRKRLRITIDIGPKVMKGVISLNRIRFPVVIRARREIAAVRTIIITVAIVPDAIQPDLPRSTALSSDSFVPNRVKTISRNMCDSPESRVVRSDTRRF